MKKLKKLVEKYKKEYPKVKPSCPHFPACGGCFLQDISYEDQLKIKKKVLESIGLNVDILPSPKIWYYRNRMDYICYDGKIGLRKRGTWNKVVEIKECKLMSEESNKILKEIRELVKDLEFYDIKQHQGYLRYVVLREGKFTGEKMVIFVTNGKEDKISKIAEKLNVKSVVWENNNSLSDVSFGEIVKYWGSDHIIEKLGKTKYIIRSNSFFQTNPYQAKNVYEKIKEEVSGEKEVLDLFCGSGGISLYISEKVEKVKGIEINEEAIKNAEESAKLNDIKNVEFEVRDARKLKIEEGYDVVIVDPPRAGLGRKLSQELNKFKKIIYMSCNPFSQMEDLKYMDHKIVKAYAFDMFPHTPHIETLLVLEK